MASEMLTKGSSSLDFLSAVHWSSLINKICTYPVNLVMCIYVVLCDVRINTHYHSNKISHTDTQACLWRFCLAVTKANLHTLTTKTNPSRPANANTEPEYAS